MPKTESFISHRAAQRVLVVLAIAGGSAIALLALPHTCVPHIARYIYGDRKGVPGVADRIPAYVSADLFVILGYVLVLGGFACYFRTRAASVTGRLVAGYVVAAVVLTALADLAEDGLLYLTVHNQKSTILINATSAAATVKWCALLIALLGIPTTVGILFRQAAAWCRYGRLTSAEDAATAWWDRVLIPKEQTGVRSPGTTTPLVTEDEWSWVEAYSVPGANDVLDRRKEERVQAICLSGGGVRSACVAMGALQVFSTEDKLKTRDDPQRFGKGVEPKLVDTVDYIISVSGGGYTAGARLLALQSDPESPLISQRFEDGSVEFDHFRRGSSYIADSPADLIRALAEVLKNLLASLTILFTLPILMGWVFGYLLARPQFSFAAIVPVPNPLVDQGLKRLPRGYSLCLISHPASWYAVGFFAASAVIFTTVAIVIELLSWQEGGETWKMRMQRLAVGSAVFGLVVLAVAVGLPVLMRLCSTLSLHASDNPGAAAATFSGVVGLNYLAAVVAMAWKKRTALSEEAAKLSTWKRLLPPGIVPTILVTVTLAVLLIAWLTTLGVFAAAVFRTVTADGVEGGSRYVPNVWFVGALVVTILWIGVVDVTSVSLHPFYRRRLARTFAVRRVRAPGGGWRAKRYEEIEWTWLPDYGQVPGDRGPRFIFAAAATITGDGKPAPGLNAVSYVLSGDHIGGPELGWLHTPTLFAIAPPRIKRDLTVVAAVAVSGAAFASAMGRQQKGFEKLLAVSGARLGTWLPNPNFVASLKNAEDGTGGDEKENRRPWPKWLPTIRGAGYFYRELFGFNYNDARLVQISDGGHYENLGLVEALRRRSRLIFCFDGGGDTPPLLSGLADAIRLAKYELGVTITFDSADYPLTYLAPGSGTLPEDKALESLKDRVTKKTVAVATITYPAASGLAKDDRKGVLIYAKAVLSETCPQWLLTYAASNVVFPHDPTSDQWFNEGQFAAYTALGRIMGAEAYKAADYVLK
ncbi:hypothetical protein [Mycobacterium sp. E3339]|uniref:hypothetical protein n=1 Tax=Mycobacterium sp. E3339 TaxID=1834146 RepID=UPI000AB26548|nr:hypothetical protein [Mycobacterium sp. E3339]